MATYLHGDRDAKAAIDAYIEYTRIVGSDDGGKLFTPKEYERYRMNVAAKRPSSRIYVVWTSSKGLECKAVGPETRCFCGHRYKQHQTDFPDILSSRDAKVKCKERGCGCVRFRFTPVVGGSRPARCKCKHEPNDHRPRKPFKCDKCDCKGFHTAFPCACGEPATTHVTLIETTAERTARGMPLGPESEYAALGGLTSFSSLTSETEAQMVGGARPEKDPQKPRPRDVTGYGHVQHQSASKGKKLTEEEEMAFYEKRYQQRRKAEQEQSRMGVLASRPGLAAAWANCPNPMAAYEDIITRMSLDEEESSPAVTSRAKTQQTQPMSRRGRGSSRGQSFVASEKSNITRRNTQRGPR